MPLSKYKSMCQKRQKEIVSKEKGKQHVAVNVDLQVVLHYRVDGCVITSGTRCDYIVINQDKKNIYFIELKGRDISHALEQLDATEKVLKPLFYGYRFHFRVVVSRATHDVKTNKYVKYRSAKEKQGISFKCESVMLRESI